MIESYLNKLPKIAASSKVFPGAMVIGDVTIGEQVGVWYNAVIRGDMAPVSIGDNTNIQDGAILHTNTDLPTHVGANVTVGHGAIIHAATVEDDCLIGMGSIILDGAIIRKHAFVAAGCVVPPGKEVPEKSLVMGNPMRVVKVLSDDDLEGMKKNKDYYVKLLKEYA